MNFIFDIDGTICFGNNKIENGIYAQLEKIEEAGHNLIFATARSYRDTLPVIKERFKDNTVVALNGGLVYRSSKSYLEKHINKNSFEKLIAEINDKDLPYFIDDSFNYACYKEEKMAFIKTVDPLKMANKIDVNQMEKPIKLVVYTGDLSESDFNEFYEEINKIPELDVVYHEREGKVYINSANVTKATTIVEILEGQDYIAYGNDKNDIDMFKSATYAVQVGNLKYLEDYNDEKVAESEVANNIAKQIERLRSRV
ncbi:MAG: HAD-IIB family hydrolase [Gemella sp.]|nr:HAD-IIB family hydrolase [Gemella sp.]